jgi:hypothetical protein
MAQSIEAAGWRRTDGCIGIRVPVEVRILSTPRRPDELWSPLIFVQWVPGLKLAGREANHSHSTSAEVKKTRIYITTPPYVFMA